MTYTHYFGSDLATLYLGDSLEVMDDLDADSVDLIFADPPYNLSNGGFTCKSGRMVSVHKGDWDVSKGQEADLAFIDAWLSGCKRVLKSTGTIWVSGTHHVIFNVGYMMERLGFHTLNMVTWFKPNASPNLSCRFFTHSTELLIWAAPERYSPLRHTFNYDEMRKRNRNRQMRDFWVADQDPVIIQGPPGAEEKQLGRHPTQKPEKLLDLIVSASSNRGDLVLDPFNGSGTTGVVATGLGRRYIGIDMDAAHLDLTKRRILARAAEPEQMDLPVPT